MLYYYTSHSQYHIHIRSLMLYVHRNYISKLLFNFTASSRFLQTVQTHLFYVFTLVRFVRAYIQALCFATIFVKIFSRAKSRNRVQRDTKLRQVSV